MIYLDTHAAIFLYQGATERFSSQTLQLIEDDDDLRLSPMALLELEYLYEIKRTTVSARRIAETLGNELGLTICDLAFPVVVSAALAEKWTRDPFDRLIVASARLQDARIVTRDRQMLKHYSQAVS